MRCVQKDDLFVVLKIGCIEFCQFLLKGVHIENKIFSVTCRVFHAAPSSILFFQKADLLYNEQS